MKASGQDGVPGKVDGTDGQPTTKHVDHLHWQIKTTGRLVQAHAEVCRG